jgi:hypothetical protein
VVIWEIGGEGIYREDLGGKAEIFRGSARCERGVDPWDVEG